jgi:hypothetical protein
MSGFPGGWQFSDTASGGAASIIVPAVAGVVNVLDVVQADLVAFGATAAFGPALQIIIGGIVVLSWQLIVQGVAGSTPDRDSFSASGLDIAAPVGVAITVQFSLAIIATTAQNLLIQGHCI